MDYRAGRGEDGADQVTLAESSESEPAPPEAPPPGPEAPPPKLERPP